MSDKKDAELADLHEQLTELRLSEERYRHMNQLVSDYAYSFNVGHDMSMRGEWVSESFGRVFGFTIPQIDERGGWQSLVYPDDLAVAAEHARRVLSGHQDVCEMRFVTSDGQPRWLRDHAAPVFDEQQGRVVRIYGVSQDITEKKNAAEELRRKQQFLDSIFTSIQDGISILDPELRIVYVNDVMRKWYAGNLPLEGKKCYQAYHGRDTPCEPCPTLRCLRSGKTERDVVPGLAGSSVEWIELFSYPHSDPESGKIGMVVEFVRDITEQRRLQGQLLLAQKMEAIGRLAGGVAHDFNNLLSVIIGRSDLLLHDLPEDDPTRKEVAEILDAGRRAETITRQLLAFSRRQVLQPVVLNFNQVITGIDGLIGRLIGEDIEVSFVLDDELGNASIDRGQLEQVVMNLVVNSRDAMPRGGKLTIETLNVELDEEYAKQHPEVEPGQYVMLAICDTGSGMDGQTRKKIFDPFFTTKEEGRGTGLGLAMVYGIVKQSGGHIWVYSEPGHGTSFKIYLPRVFELADERASRAPVASRTGAETVLVAEDNRSVRSFVTTALETLGYSVLEAPDAERALELAEKNSGKIDLLLTDVVLTGMSGRELAEKLQPHAPGVKVLYMSGYTTNAIVNNGVLEAGLHFLAKPFTLNDLSEKLRNVLDG